MRGQSIHQNTMIHFLTILAQAPAAPAPPTPQGMNPIIMLLFMVALFYFLLIRPQQKRQKEHAKRVSALKSGDRIITNSGLHGLVANVKEKTIVVKIAENVKVEMEKDSVATVLKAAEGEA